MKFPHELVIEVEISFLFALYDAIFLHKKKMSSSKPQEEDHDHVIRKVESKQLAKHLYSRHGNDFFAYLNLLFTTPFMFLVGKSLSKPSLITWIVGAPASELGHLFLLLQVLNLYRVFSYNPRVFKTWFGKLALLLNGWSGWRVFKHILGALHTRQEFSKVLLEQKIQPRAGNSLGTFSGLASLIPLFLVSRRGKQIKIDRNLRYADLEKVDPYLLDLWKRTPTKLRNIHQLILRGRVSNWLSLDVFRLGDLPANARAPVYVHIHGGGWALGDKFYAAHALLNRIASRGIVCCSVNYRLSPEVAWPEHILDCKRALIYIKKNCAMWGGDPNLVFVGGESAGGHLSAFLGVTPNHPEFQAPEDKDFDTSVAGSLPIYGVFDFTDSYGYHKVNEARILGLPVGIRGFASRVVLQVPFNQENIQVFNSASPTYRLKELLKSSNPPKISPFFIPHGTMDTLAAYEDSKAFYDILQQYRSKTGTWKQGENDIFATVTGGLHAFGYFPSPRSHAMGDAFSDFIFHHSQRIREEIKI